MADNKGTIRTLVGYDLDKSSLQNVLNANNALAASTTKAVNTINTPAVKSLNADFANLSPRIQTARKDIDDLRQGIADYANGLNTVDAATNRWDGDLTKLRNSIQGVREASAGGLGDVTGGAGGLTGGGTGRGGAITQFGSKLRQLPSIQLPGLGIGTDQVANIIRMAGALNEAAQAIPGVTAATTLLTPAIGATAASLTAMLIPVAAVAIAVAPLIIAFKILADREAEAAKSAKLLADVYASQADAFAVGQRAVQDRNEGTKKEAVDLFNSLNESFRTNVEKIAFLNDKKTKSDEKTAAELQKTIDATIEEQIKLSGSIDLLRGNLEQIGTVINGTLPGLSKVSNDINSSFLKLISSIIQLGNEAKTKITPFIEKFREIAEEAKKRADKEVKIVDKLNADLVSIDQKAADTRLNIGKHLTETLIEINDKAADNAKKILADLVQQQAASALKLSRDENNALERENFNSLGRLIDFQRQELAARKRHDLDLKQLREDAADQEFDDSLDRNFAAIAQGRRNLTRAVARSNEDFNAEEQARLDAFQNKNDDAARQFAFEHEQRIQAYEQQAADQIAAAKAALKQNESDRRKLRVLAQQAANQDYADLLQKTTQERNLKIAGAIADLQLVTQTQQVMQQAYAASLAQAQALLDGIVAGSSGSNTSVSGTGSASAFGGSAATSSIRGFTNTRTSAFPTSSLSSASSGGSTGGGGSLNLTQNNYFTGADPKTILPAVYKQTRNQIADAIQRMT